MLAVTLAEIPTTPGCYTFTGADGRPLYIGKAVNLRARLTSHLRDPDPRLVRMLEEATELSWIECANEAEALVVEAGRIAALQPRYNVRLREADPYPYLALTGAGSTGVPRFQLWRGPARRGVQRFGPWPQREVLEALRRVGEEVYGVRSCADGVFERAQRSGRPCLLAELGRCAAPCVGRVEPAEHQRRVDELRAVLRGATAPARRAVDALMAEAAAEQAYERAARMRDLAEALTRIDELQRVQGLEGRSVDAVGVARSGPVRTVQLCSVRDGALVATRTLVLDGEATEAELVARVLGELYRGPGGGDGRVTEVLVPVRPAGDWDALLTAHFARTVRLAVPARGPRRALLELATVNAGQQLARELRRRDADPGRRAAVLAALGGHLGIPAPWRIECFDISHTQGRVPVAACVVLEDALPVPGEYRTIHVPEGGDDYAGMELAVRRRYQPVAAGRRAAPDLVLIDGGPGQLAAARAALDALGLTIPTVALAKRLEEVWLDAETAVVLPGNDPALHVLQRARDEAHRFSRARHRARRAKATLADPLDLPPVDGLGPARRVGLLAAFATRPALEAAPVDALVAAGLPPAVARALHAALHPAVGGPTA